MSDGRIRIAHVAGGLTNGGVEAVVYRYMKEIGSDKLQLVYISYNPADEAVKKRFEEIGFKVYCVTRKKDNFFKSYREVYEILKDNRIQIVHSHMTLMCFITSYLGWRTGAKARIAHAHLALEDKGLHGVANRLCKVLNRVTSTHYYACGETAGRYLFGDRAFDSGKVCIMNNALDCTEFAYNPEVRKQMRAELGIDEDTVVLGHVGRFTEQKNHDFLLRIFCAYKNKVPNAVLLLLGDGPLMDETRKLAAELGIADSVRFIGPSDCVCKWVQAMDCFVFPSCYEGFGIVAVEAQLAGLPVFASDKVVPEAALIDTMQFYSLDETPEKWADRIMITKDRASASSAATARAIEHGLDIRTEAAKLYQHYCEMTEE